jgi:hypothetical protein
MSHRTNIVKRMSLAVVASLFATAVLAVVPAVTSPASASTPACPVAVTHPNISIYQESHYVSYAITQTCGGALDSAGWEMVGPGGWDDTSIFYPGGLYNTFYGWYEGKHLGKYTLYPLGAYDTSYNTLPQATETFYVKIASRVSLSGYRSGVYVYVHAYVSRYNPDANYGLGGWTPSSGRYVTFQQLYSGSWHNIATKTTGSNGWTSYQRVYAPTHRYFVSWVSQNAYRWNATSNRIWR